jgi:hypothetical protein
LETVTLAVPAEATSGARIDALRWVESTNVVPRAEPFQRTTDDELKFVPSTFSVKAAAPAVVCDGRTAVVVGAGLFTVNDALSPDVRFMPLVRVAVRTMPVPPGV